MVEETLRAALKFWREETDVLIYLQTISSANEREKFTRLYERYRGLMFCQAHRILPETQDAEDAVHQAFLSILEHLDKITDVDCPKTRAYVVIIAESRAIDILRSRKRLVSAEDCAELPAPEILMDSGSDLARAMARLPARYREALLLRFDMGYTTKELSALFGMNRAAVQKLLWRAKDALRQELEKEGD